MPLQSVVYVSSCPAVHRNGEVPSRWRHSFPVPTKKPPRNNAKNYRPVSTTYIFARTSENILKRHLVAHLKDTILFLPTGMGFARVNRLLLFYHRL